MKKVRYEVDVVMDSPRRGSSSGSGTATPSKVDPGQPGTDYTPVRYTGRDAQLVDVNIVGLGRPIKLPAGLSSSYDFSLATVKMGFDMGATVSRQELDDVLTIYESWPQNVAMDPLITNLAFQVKKLDMAAAAAT